MTGDGAARGPQPPGIPGAFAGTVHTTGEPDGVDLRMTDRTGLRVRQSVDTPVVSEGPPRGAPVRMCVGCRSTDSWSVLLRVVAVRGSGTAQVRVVPDQRHRLPGRGAWLHPSSTCFEQAVRRKAFVRALRLQAGPDVSEVAAHLDLLQVHR